MFYQRIHDQIIDKYRGITPIGYFEIHHIIPRCMGGSNDPSNLVKLPAREHFIVHQCLAKIHKGAFGGKLIVAAFLMSKDGKHGSRDYAWLRAQYQEVNRINNLGNKRSLGFKHSAETRALWSRQRKGKAQRHGPTGKPAWNKGLKMPEGHGDGARRHNLGKKPSDKALAALARRNAGNNYGKGKLGNKYGPNEKKRTPEHCRKMALARINESPETRLKRAAAIRAAWARRKSLVHPAE